MILKGENQSTRRDICPAATLSTTNPHELGQDRKATSVRGRRPTSRAMTLP